jgi:hypothetical protein
LAQSTQYDQSSVVGSFIGIVAHHHDGPQAATNVAHLPAVRSNKDRARGRLDCLPRWESLWRDAKAKAAMPVA